MDEMANAAEVIDKNAREAETLRILLLAQELKATGKDLDDLIDALKNMVAKQ